MDAAAMSGDQKSLIVRNPETTPEGRTEMYDVWGKDSQYEKDKMSQNYKPHTVIGSPMQKYLTNSKDVRILDVGAGTGLAAITMRDLGFTNIDALDPSEGMLKIAKTRDLYRTYLVAYFTSHVEEVESSAYDVLVTTGTMVQGHLKCDTLPEMIRCVKTGGLILLVGREKDVLTIAEYKDRLEPLMKQLEDEGKWTMLERTVFPNYITDWNGILFVFKVTK